MHGATDAAKNAADIVLTEPGLSAIYSAVVESRKIFQRLRAYVLYRLAATVQIVLAPETPTSVHGKAQKNALRVSVGGEKKKLHQQTDLELRAE